MAQVDAKTVGSRIAEARARASLTQTDLATAVSLDRSALAKIEAGSRRVSALELSRIADVLDERIEWFVVEAPPAIVSHRNLLAPGEPSPLIDKLIETVTRNVEFLRERDTQLKLSAVPELSRPGTAEDAEQASLEARKLLGLDELHPLHSATEKAASLGILTFSVELGTNAADAASVLLPLGGVVLVNGNLQVGRRRLAFAHELGHCLFADEYTVDWSVVEPSSSSAWESRLDRFARAVLLPQAGLRSDWRSCKGHGDSVRTSAVRLASKYRVDMATLARRLLEIDEISGIEASKVRETRTTKADIVDLNLVSHEELEAPDLPRPYVQSVLRLYRNDEISSARALDLLMDLWTEDDLPPLPKLPESAIWQFIS